MRALVLVDIQPTFMPGGELPVPNGDEVVPVANEMIKKFRASGDVVAATRDWHPEVHCSFAECYDGPDAPYEIFDKVVTDGVERTLWPKHGVQDTAEAEFHPDLELDESTIRINKGMDPNVDSHSAFWGHARLTKTELADKLREAGVKKGDQVFFLGLATGVCLILSALDSVAEGYETIVIIDGCRAITSESHRKAVADMIDAGISVVFSRHVE